MSGSIVVTGSTGRIGRAVADELAASGTDVIGIDMRPGPFTSHVADLTVADLAPILEGSAAIIHCAALHAPHVGFANASEFVAVNVIATERLAAAAPNAGIRRFVFTSSTSVYGDALIDSERAVWVDEELRPQPRDIYDVTKLEAEQVVAEAHVDSLSTITLRVARCFPEEWRTTVVNRLSRGVDLRDVVAGLTTAVAAELTEHRILNMAGPRLFEREDAVRLRHDAASVLRVRFPWLAAEFADRGWSLPDSIDRIYVSDRAHQALGWAPRHGIESALSTDPGGPVQP